MATTINSGYANSPKLTANIADHADVYGGRSLVFDGVVDRLSTPNITTSATSTYSFWINLNSVSGTQDLFTHANIYFRAIDNELYVYSDFSNHARYDNVLVTGSWNHIAWVANGSTHKVYINGEELTPNATTSSAIVVATNAINIGSAGNPFAGKMADFKYYHSALSESDVQSLYKKPESVPSPSTLVAWYPMIEGNPESPQSIVYDHSEKKLSSDTFVGLNQWSPKVVDRESVSVSGDELTLTIPSANDAGMSTGNLANLGLSTSLGYAVGDLVKLQFEGKITTNGSGFGETLRWYDTQEYVFSVTNISLTSEYQTFTFYGVISNLGYSIPYLLRMGSRTGTDIYKFKNFSVQKVQMGNHATTNFFGDELVTNGDYNSASSWNTSSGTVSIDTSAGKAVFTNAGSVSLYQDIGSNLTGLYRITFDITDYTSGTLKVYGGGQDSYGDGDLTSYTSTGSYVQNITLESNFNGNIIFGGGNFNGSIDNVSVKKAGVSLSGFATAQEEPTIPQVPLMRYNQKMHFNGHYVYLPSTLTSASNYTLVGWINTLNTGQAHIFQGASGNDNFQMHSGRVWWYQDGNHYSTTYINDGQTYMIAYQREGNNYSIWVNGIKETSWTQTAYNDYQTFKFSKIGNSVSSRPYKGVINEVSAWNTALSTSEMQELFNEGVALDATTHSKKGNLLAYYRNDGVITWQDRKGWSYLDFTTNDYLQTASAVDAFGTNPFSFSIWINQHNTIQSAMFSNAQWNNNEDWFFASIKSGSSGLLGLGTYSAWKHKFDTNLVQTNKWHLVTYVREGTGTNQSKWYLDGTLIDTDTDSTDWKAGSYLNIGSYVTNSGFLDGQISQLAIYHNKALSASEVSDQFSNGISSKFTTSGATHHFVMDNGTTIVDLVGGNNATNNGATYVSGDGTVSGSPDSITIREGLNSNRDGLGFYFKNPSSNVLRLNGLDEQIIVPDTDFNFSGQMTFECWAKNNSDNNTVNEFLISQWDYSNNQRAFRAYIHSNGALYCTISNTGSGSNTSQVNTTSAISNLDNWHHYAFTFSSGTFVIYIDAVAVTISTGSVVASITSIYNSTADIQIGSQYPPNATGGEWNGLIDEIKLYNRALSADEIQKNYKHQKGKHKND